jgi:hypothetical protein
METFLGIAVQQDEASIKLHLDLSNQETLAKYNEYIKKTLCTKRLPISPGVILSNKGCPEILDQRKQPFCRSSVAKVQFTASLIDFDIAFVI